MKDWSRMHWLSASALCLAVVGCRLARVAERPADQATMSALAESGNRFARHMRRQDELVSKLVGELSAWVGRSFYTCCNLSFDEDGEASDANYLYLNVANNLIPVGTRVKVTGIFPKHVEIQPEGSDRVYALWFGYGAAQTTAERYFRSILREEDPKENLKSADPAIARAIEDGQLLVGMTKEQTLMARGYPPFHQTPGLESDSWLFYRSSGKGQLVKFRDGRIYVVQEGAAP